MWLWLSWPFRVVNDGGKPIIEVTYREELKRFKVRTCDAIGLACACKKRALAGPT
jgi:hypothetical protein